MNCLLGVRRFCYLNMRARACFDKQLFVVVFNFWSSKNENYKLWVIYHMKDKSLFYDSFDINTIAFLRGCHVGVLHESRYR